MNAADVPYVRRNGPYTLIEIATPGYKLPFGNLPRLLLAWVCTEARHRQAGKGKVLPLPQVQALSDPLGAAQARPGASAGERPQQDMRAHFTSIRSVSPA